VYIEKIRPIDKQLSYQIDKLLRATAKAQASADVDAAAAGQQQQQNGAAAAAGGDALQFRPNPQALIAKLPLVGDTAGGWGRGADAMAVMHPGR
jgi:U3 small nucleolar RNA-associated protein 3